MHTDPLPGPYLRKHHVTCVLIPPCPPLRFRFGCARLCSDAGMTWDMRQAWQASRQANMHGLPTLSGPAVTPAQHVHGEEEKKGTKD